MLDIEGEVGEEKQHYQAEPVMQRDRDRRDPDPVNGSSDDTEDQPMRRSLGEKMADSHDGRDARVLPRIGSLPIEDQQPLDHGCCQKDRQKDEDYRAGAMTQQVIEADVRFHRYPTSKMARAEPV